MKSGRRAPGLPLWLVALSVLVTPTSACVEELPPNRGPYLSWTADPRTSMTITWESLDGAERTLEYGETPDALDRTAVVTISAKPRDDRYHHHTATLTGLQPGSRYYYRIPGIQEPAVSFRTAPDDQTTPFRFVVYGDSRERLGRQDNQHYELVDQMLARQDATDLAFTVNTGDLSLVHNSVRGWDLHFDAIRPLANQTPYFVSSGNHEWNDDEPADEKQVTNLIHEFPQGEPGGPISGYQETSFAFGYSCAWVVFLGLTHTGLEADHPVNDWFEEQLRRGERDYRFTFVVYHEPPFDRRAGGYAHTSNQLAHQVPLMHQLGVNAVFNGHNHVLGLHEIRLDPDGAAPDAPRVTYVVTGGGGSDLRDALHGTWDDRYGFGFRGETLYAEKVYHFYEVDVDCASGEASMTPIDRQGRVVHDPHRIQATRP